MNRRIVEDGTQPEFNSSRKITPIGNVFATNEVYTTEKQSDVNTQKKDKVMSHEERQYMLKMKKKFISECNRIKQHVSLKVESANKLLEQEKNNEMKDETEDSSRNEEMEKIKFVFGKYKLDSQFCFKYLPDIFATMFEKETLYKPKYGYLEMQKSITKEMRSTLIDWLTDVHDQFGMVQETLFLATNIIDRFLSVKIIPRRMMQLVGISSLLVAAKYEEIYYPALDELVKTCVGIYKKEQILDMEMKIVNALKFNFTVVTADAFMLKIIFCFDDIVAFNIRRIIFNVSSFFLELSLQIYDFLKYKPSKIAAAAVYLAGRLLLDKKFVWNERFQFFSSYQENDILGLAKIIYNKIYYQYSTDTVLTAVRRKYKSQQRNNVSALIKKRLFGASSIKPTKKQRKKKTPKKK